MQKYRSDKIERSDRSQSRFAYGSQSIGKYQCMYVIGKHEKSCKVYHPLLHIMLKHISSPCKSSHQIRSPSSKQWGWGSSTAKHISDLPFFAFNSLLPQSNIRSTQPPS